MRAASRRPRIMGARDNRDLRCGGCGMKAVAKKAKGKPVAKSLKWESPLRDLVEEVLEVREFVGRDSEKDLPYDDLGVEITRVVRITKRVMLRLSCGHVVQAKREGQKRSDRLDRFVTV